MRILAQVEQTVKEVVFTLKLVLLGYRLRTICFRIVLLLLEEQSCGRIPFLNSKAIHLSIMWLRSMDPTMLHMQSPSN